MSQVEFKDTIAYMSQTPVKLSPKELEGFKVDSLSGVKTKRVIVWSYELPNLGVGDSIKLQFTTSNYNRAYQAVQYANKKDGAQYQFNIVGKKHAKLNNKGKGILVTRMV